MRLNLENHEALVLIEFLIRFRNEEKLEIQHEAEEQILWDLCAMIEKEVPELLDEEYKKLLNSAREKVIKNETF